MKQIIDGKIYNTETATLIGECGNGLSCSDFDFVHEALYRTKKGRFFLAGEGGAKSRYARPVKNGTIGGEGIIPLTDGEALGWAQANMRADDIIEAFADSIDDA